MAVKIGLMCLLSVAGALAQCGEAGWYGPGRLSAIDEYPSFEDRAPSFEEASDEYYPMKQQRSLRSSRYPSPNDGYSSNFRQDGGDWERYGGSRKSHYDPQKSRRKYGTYGKGSRTEYNIKGTLNANAYERKKINRAAKYTGESASYGKTTSLTFTAVPPKPNCAQNLLIGCTPTVTRVPCSAGAHSQGYGHAAPAPYYPPVPMYHQHVPVPEAHYEMSHPYASYGHPSPSYYPPPPYPKGPAASDHHTKPTPEGAHGYGPSYKAAVPEEMPGFAAPVQESLSESPKVPIISAFPKPTDSTPSGSSPAASSKGAHNATVEHETTSTTVNPVPVLTPAPERKDENDAFWGVESNVESSTDVTEGSTAR